MKILGIDQSLRATGWFAYDTETQVETQGTIEPSKDLSPIDRLDVLETRFRWLLDETQPNAIGIEGYAYCGPGRARELGELGGVLRVVLIRAAVRCYEISPGTLKKFVTGKGSGDKDVMLLYTFKNFGMEFRDHNISDAFGIALMVCARENQANIRLPARLTKPQTEALAAINILVNAPSIHARTRTR